MFLLICVLFVFRGCEFGFDLLDFVILYVLIGSVLLSLCSYVVCICCDCLIDL